MKGINDEIKRIQKTSKNVQTRAKDLKNGILEYLDSTNQPEVEYDNIVVKSIRKPKRKPKKKTDKKDDIVKYLAGLGIENPEYVYEEAEKLRTENRKVKLKHYR